MISEAGRDPRHHTQKMQTRLQEPMDHLREDIDKVEEPQLKAMFETVAEVLRLRAEERGGMAYFVGIPLLPRSQGARATTASRGSTPIAKAPTFRSSMAFYCRPEAGSSLEPRRAAITSAFRSSSISFKILLTQRRDGVYLDRSVSPMATPIR
jgi:hypothetical protein